MHGFLNIDKPAGMTSHDVVARVRKLARQKRVGHAGTLDPAATGVLIVAIGAATRLIEYVQDQTNKRYLAVVELGRTTTTDDAEGDTLAVVPVPALEQVALEDVLERFRGEILQVPPMYAAIHHNGRRLHELARAGEVVERAARPVTIEQLELLDWTSPYLTLDILSSKGTYIRAIARDLGEALGCGGHLKSLRRTAVGSFTLETAVPLAELAAVDQSSTNAERQIPIAEALLAPELAVAAWPRVDLEPQQAQRIRNGMAIELPELNGTHARAHTQDGTLLALLVYNTGYWRPEKVFDI